MMPVTVPADAIFATSETIRSMPCARSTSEMSTVTPHTMTITRHGMRLIASPSSADLDSTSSTAPDERGHPDVRLADHHAEDQRGDDADRDPVTAFETRRMAVIRCG